MAKKPLVYTYDPKKGFGDLAAHEQGRLVRFLATWVTQTQDPGAKWAMVRKYPKIVAWLGAQRPTTKEWKEFATGGQVLTPAQRVAIKLPREAGPRFGPRETPDQARARYGAAANIAAEEYDRAFRARGTLPRETAEQARARYRAAARMAAEEYAKAFAESRVPRETPEELRARVRENARVTAEEYAKAFEESRVRETPEQLRMRVRKSAKITAEEYAKAFEVSREKGQGTVNERRALARLKAGRGYAPNVAVRIYDEGLWEAMERLDPGCTEKVLENWVLFETSRWAGKLLGGKKPWELTRAEVAASGLSQEQLNRVAAGSPQIHQRLESIGVETQRPMPVGVMLRSIRQLGRVVPKGEGFWLTIPGPLPLKVPVPAVRTWGRARGVLPQRLERERGMPWEPLRTRLRRLEEARERPAEAVYAGKGPAVKPPAKIPVAKAVMQAMPEVIGTALQMGAIPAESGLAEVYGAYALSQMAKSALVRAGVAGAVAGPLGIVMGLASLFSGWRRARGARRERRELERKAREAAAARFLVGQVGYVPRTAGVQYMAGRRRGYARPFVPLYGSRLGLAAATRTPPARI